MSLVEEIRWNAVWLLFFVVLASVIGVELYYAGDVPRLPVGVEPVPYFTGVVGLIGIFYLMLNLCFIGYLDASWFKKQGGLK